MGNFDLSNSPCSGIPVSFDNNVLWTEMEENPYQTIEELSDRFNTPWSTIQEHLKRIDKVN